MSQLALDLLREVPPTLENFVVGANGECLQALRALREGRRTHRFIYLWGLPGSGRSHLARALASAPRRPAQAPGVPAGDGTDDDLLVVDDVDRLGPDAQLALFGQFIAAAGRPERAIVTTGERPPLALALRDDLRSRLGAGLVFEVRGLADSDRAQAIAQAADARGVTLSADLIPWLLTHHSRDMRVLLATLEALDRYALTRKRPITLPLLRDWLAESAGKML